MKEFIEIYALQCGSEYCSNLQEYKYVSSKRIAYFYSSKPQPHQFTILVSNIPVSVGSSVSNSVESFFTEYHPSTYLSHVVVRRTNKLQDLIVSSSFLATFSPSNERILFV